MPKSINRPRDDAESEQMQQGPIDLAEDAPGEQLDDAEDSSEQRSPA